MLYMLHISKYRVEGTLCFNLYTPIIIMNIFEWFWFLKTFIKWDSLMYVYIHYGSWILSFLRGTSESRSKEFINSKWFINSSCTYLSMRVCININVHSSKNQCFWLMNTCEWLDSLKTYYKVFVILISYLYWVLVRAILRWRWTNNLKRLFYIFQRGN